MRIVLFILTNIAMAIMVSLVITLGTKFFGIQSKASYAYIAMSCMAYGSVAAFLSLLLSKVIAKWTMNLQIIDGTESQTTQWLYGTVAGLAQRANIPMPEVAIYEGAPNAFATGPSQNSSLVAVSSGLLETLNYEEIEAVLAHEIAHIANGDMVTIALVQGIVNSFTMFLSRIITLGMRDNNGHLLWVGVFATFALDILFGLLGSLVVAWVSREREFRADWGAAELLGQAESMKRALIRLHNTATGDLSPSMRALGIAPSAHSLFSTHPSVEERIESLNRF